MAIIRTGITLKNMEDTYGKKLNDEIKNQITDKFREKPELNFVPNSPIGLDGDNKELVVYIGEEYDNELEVELADNLFKQYDIVDSESEPPTLSDILKKINEWTGFQNHPLDHSKLKGLDLGEGKIIDLAQFREKVTREAPDELQALETIRQSHNQNAPQGAEQTSHVSGRTPVPGILMYDWTGGRFRKQEDQYRAICMNMSPQFSQHVIFYDDDALLVKETNQQLEEFVKKDRPDLSEEDRANVIRKLREDLYQTLKDESVETRETAWISWLETTCRLSKEDREDIENNLKNWKQENKDYPQYMAKTFGVDASKIEMRSINSLFSTEGRNLSPKEQELLKSQKHHYDRYLLQRCNPAGASDIARLVGLYESGGMRLDADTLPAIKPELFAKIGITQKQLIEAKLIDATAKERETNAAIEALIQRYLLTYREDLMYPGKPRIEILDEDELSKEMHQIDKVFSQAKEWGDVFNELPRVSTFSRLFGANIAFKIGKPYELSTDKLAAHPSSESILEAREMQVEVMNYCEDFDKHCMEREAAAEATGKKFTYEEYHEFRRALAEEYLDKNPWPQHTDFATSKQKKKFSKILTDDPFDGLVKNAMATVEITGPGILKWIAEKKVGKEPTELERLQILNHDKLFGLDSIQAWNSSWMKKDAYKNTYTFLKSKPLRLRLKKTSNLLTDLDTVPDEQKKRLWAKLTKAEDSLAVTANSLSTTPTQLDSIHAVVTQIQKERHRLTSPDLDSDPSSDEETRHKKKELEAFHLSAKREPGGGQEEQDNDWLLAEQRQKVRKIMGLKPIEELPKDDYLSCQFIRHIKEGKVTGIVVSKPGTHRRQYLIPSDEIHNKTNSDIFQPGNPIELKKEREKEKEKEKEVDKYLITSRVQEAKQSGGMSSTPVESARLGKAGKFGKI